MLKVYLAGKMDGHKRNIANGIKSCGFTGTNEYEFNHGCDRNWDAGLPYKIASEEFVPRVRGCAALIALIDAPDAFGTIAEIAYASAIGKNCCILIDKSADVCLECSKQCGFDPADGECDCSCHYYGPDYFFDQCWFVSTMPGVEVRLCDDIEHAVKEAESFLIEAGIIKACESPIEQMFFDA